MCNSVKTNVIDLNTFKIRFPELYNIISQYYGGDIPARKIENLILDRIGNTKKYKDYWKNGVLKSISKEIDYNIQGITFGYVPNYGAQIEFVKDLSGGQKAITQIQFYVSFLANVYTIQILEIKESMKHHSSLNMDLSTQTLQEIWVSPENHMHKNLFLKIKIELETILENPIYLPYSIQQIELKKIKLPQVYNSKRNTIGDAFFKKILPLYHKDAVLFGNPNYKIDELI